MEEKTKFGLNANVKIELFSEKGELKEVREIHNVLTDAGVYGIMDQVLASPTLVKMGWMELGTGTGGTTKLNAYVASSKVAFTSKTRTNKVVTVVGTFPAGTGTGTITEAGTFDAVTQNAIDMWMYASFTAIAKGANDTLTITWTLTGANY
jgi:hypothetical protein